MAENLGKVVSGRAAADLSGHQYRFMSLDSNGRFAATGDGADADGVLQNDPAAVDREASVMVGAGYTKMEAGAVVTRGGNVASDSVGRVVNAASGDYIMGKAREAAAAAGEIITVLFQPRGSIAP